MLIFITEKKLLIFCGAKPCGDRLTDDLVSTGQVAMGSNRAGTGGLCVKVDPDSGVKKKPFAWQNW